MQGEATLRLLDKADKEILKLSRDVKGAIYDFQHKFRKSPANPGLHFKQLKGHPRLYSARVNQEYRALLLHAGESDYILVAVKHRKDVYDNLDRFAYQINPVTGGIEFVDLVSIEKQVLDETLVPSVPAGKHVGEETSASSAPNEKKARHATPDPSVSETLFAAFTAEQLLDLGVAEPLLGLIAKITTEDELLGLVEYAPQLTAEVLLALHDGKTLDEVLDQVTTPVTAEDPVDVEDYQAALARPATQVTTDDTALQEVLEGDFGRWRVFLHPTQRKVVERNYSGPARISGGPGTGKTIVTLHRVKHLVDTLGPGDDKAILFTTFNKNLAADLRQRLLELAGAEVAKRVEIVNIDKLATQIVAEAEPGGRRRWIDDTKALLEWEDLLLEQGETRWDGEFLHAEWSHVILGQAINSRADYFRARRAGRGRSISREDRAAIWQLVERYIKRLDDKELWTFRQVAERAARMEIERARQRASYEAGQVSSVKLQRESGIWHRPRYRHIVVDEAQDLSAAHWKMLRAMIPEGPNDIFLAGDTHQRIYGNYVSLGSLGINIRGRSSKLTLSYRTTHEILGAALGLLGQEEWDDLDDGHDDLSGYRSVLHGMRPILRPASTWDAELDAVVEQVREWNDVALASIAICVPERRMVAEVENRLGKAGIVATAIGAEGPKLYDAIHVGTMHRFKGLEYQRMILVGVAEGLVPSHHAAQYEDTDPLRYRRELQRARSLLFVAATRARDTLVISWHGQKSRFLP
ncbi:UvrD/REP helicase N-terminal domain-containing protein [Streptosporangium subroseum]|uniref:DNA 3'-5' helicase n=1 Tax=Streptosporangium subroseum TaxID=106412 RepID=A0A239BLU6_9ACTN|nr:UvrD-helicase domain-containing protein [Streptosporangium subroseum]SNS08371.1 UvrD/REP helicase N-terminal domain-containing protein [Streptosporangium subroseum]